MSSTEPISIGSSLRWTETTPSWFEIGRPEWMSEGACIGSDPDLFFPARHETGALAEALAVCRTCPVRVECLEYAVANRDAGVWGGTTDRQRRKIRKDRGIATGTGGRRPDPANVRYRQQAVAMRDAGLNSSEIAAELNISRRTVNRYLSEAS